MLWVRVPPPELRSLPRPSSPDEAVRLLRHLETGGLLRAVGADRLRARGPTGGPRLNGSEAAVEGELLDQVSGGGSAARPGSRSAAGPSNRHGRRTPTPAQSDRAAFSAMSPTWGTASTGQPQA